MLFEMLKLEIRAKTISYSAFKKKINKEREENLEKDIEKLYDDIIELNGSVDVNRCIDLLEEKKSELEEISRTKPCSMFRPLCLGLGSRHVNLVRNQRDTSLI